MDAPARRALRRLLWLYWLAGAAPIAIVAAVVLAALWRAQLAAPALERSFAALAGLAVLVLVASALFAVLLGRSLAAAIAAAPAPPPTALAGEAARAAEREALRRALEDEKRARQAAEAASRRSAERLAALAHELRNPLGAMGNALRVLEGLPAGGADYKAAREVLARQTEHLAKTVHERLEAEAPPRGAERRSLLDLAQAVRAAVALQKGPASPAWELDLAPVLVSADPARLDQALAQRLGAAAQRAAAGARVVVRLRAEGHEAVLRIDEGGSAAEALTLRLPALPEPEPVAERVSRAPPARRPRHQARVLIVEDNEDSRVTLQRILQAEGHLVSAARDARAGLEAAAAGSPTVAVVDIGLPGMDGYAFARAMRERLGSGVRLIALTGYGSEADRRRAAEAGFDAHLTKPVDIDRLLAVIAEAS